MQFTSRYSAPLGEMLLAADDVGLTGLWFLGQKHCARTLDREHEERELPVFAQARSWLDAYFAGDGPDAADVPLHLAGTDFQRAVWGLLRAIPYGQTTTYGDLARRLAAQRGSASVSARAVGGAVGRNPVSIIVPCHRVVGADGSLTGYAGGAERKVALLKLEGTCWKRSLLPARSVPRAVVP